MATPPPGPARNGFASAVIARNAAEGARKEPTMTETKTIDALAGDIMRQLEASHELKGCHIDRGIIAAGLADIIHARYEVKHRNRPDDTAVGALCRIAGPSFVGGVVVNDELHGRNFVRLLAEDGYEIRRIEGGTE